MRAVNEVAWPKDRPDDPRKILFDLMLEKPKPKPKSKAPVVVYDAEKQRQREAQVAR